MCSIHIGIYFPQQYFVSPMTQIDNRISADDDEIIKRKMYWHSIPFDAVRVDHICNSQVPLKDQLNHFNRHEKAQHKIYWHHQSHYNFWQSQLIIAKVFKKHHLPEVYGYLLLEARTHTYHSQSAESVLQLFFMMGWHRNVIKE